MRREFSILCCALLLAACSADVVPSPVAPSASVEPTAEVLVVEETPRPYCGGEAVQGFRPNLGQDGYVTFNFERITGINIYQVEVQSRDEFGVYGRSGDWGKVIDTDNFATSRERIDPSLETRTFRARIRSFNNCGSFGAWSNWVEFGA